MCAQARPGTGGQEGTCEHREDQKEEVETVGGCGEGSNTKKNSNKRNLLVPVQFLGKLAEVLLNHGKMLSRKLVPAEW